MPDDDRDAILRRRSRWIQMALTGATAGTLATSCACLSPAYDAGPITADAGPDAGVPQPCLSPPFEEDAGPDAGEPSDAGAADAGGPDAGEPDAGTPIPCLTPALDAGPDVEDAAVDGDASTPTPCLSIAPRDAGPDAAPTPCLTPIPD